MKNLTLILLFIIPILRSDNNFDIRIITKSIESKFLKIKLKNKCKKPIIFFYGSPYSEFKIKDENNVENIGKVLSIASEEDYLDYQFDYSENLINKTKQKYKISFQEALIYLHNKENYLFILPNQCKEIDLPILKRNYTSAYSLDSVKSYYLSVNAEFSTEYVPDYIKDSLKSKNILIIEPKISVNKISININKFFRKKDNRYIK